MHDDVNDPRDADARPGRLEGDTGMPSPSNPRRASPGETVGVLGGTGPAGRGLALRLAAAGYNVFLGSRDEERGREVAARLANEWPAVTGQLVGTDNHTAVEGHIAVMAAPWEGALKLAADLVEPLRGKTVVSMANALVRAGEEFLPLTLPRGSVAAELQWRLRESRVVGAFHHLPARELANLGHELHCDVLVCGDHRGGCREVAGLIKRIAGLRPIHAGTLATAGVVEAMTAVLIRVNVRYGTHSMLRLVGDFASNTSASA
jgi:NADPH-dependent F420 reductase